MGDGYILIFKEINYIKEIGVSQWKIKISAHFAKKKFYSKAKTQRPYLAMNVTKNSKLLQTDKY